MRPWVSVDSRTSAEGETVRCVRDVADPSSECCSLRHELTPCLHMPAQESPAHQHLHVHAAADVDAFLGVVRPSGHAWQLDPATHAAPSVALAYVPKGQASHWVLF